MCDERDRSWRRPFALAGVSLVALVPASGVLAASPRPGGVYNGALVNADAVQLKVSADGKSATLTVGCLDLGETYVFTRFPIVKGAFSTTIADPISPGAPEATLRGTFASVTRASILLDEHPDRADAGRYICFGVKSPATLTLNGP